MNDKSRIIERIQKCLRKADATRNDSEAEVQTAFAMAHKLMAEHNISVTEVQFNSETQTLKEDIKEFNAGLFHTQTRYEVALCFVVDVLCHVKHYYQMSSGNPVGSLMFVGLQADTELAAEIYKELIRTVKRFMGRYPGKYKRSYALGLVARLHERALILQREQAMPTNTTALMVVKDKAVGDYMERKDLNRIKSRRLRVDGQDYENGVRDGDKIELGNRRKIGVS